MAIKKERQDKKLKKIGKNMKNFGRFNCDDVWTYTR